MAVASNGSDSPRRTSADPLVAWQPWTAVVRSRKHGRRSQLPESRRGGRSSVICHQETKVLKSQLPQAIAIICWFVRLRTSSMQPRTRDS